MDTGAFIIIAFLLIAWGIGLVEGNKENIKNLKNLFIYLVLASGIVLVGVIILIIISFTSPRDSIIIQNIVVPSCILYSLIIVIETAIATVDIRRHIKFTKLWVLSILDVGAYTALMYYILSI